MNGSNCLLDTEEVVNVYSNALDGPQMYNCETVGVQETRKRHGLEHF